MDPSIGYDEDKAYEEDEKNRQVQQNILHIWFPFWVYSIPYTISHNDNTRCAVNLTANGIGCLTCICGCAREKEGKLVGKSEKHWKTGTNCLPFTFLCIRKKKSLCSTRGVSKLDWNAKQNWITKTNTEHTHTHTRAQLSIAFPLNSLEYLFCFLNFQWKIWWELLCTNDWMNERENKKQFAADFLANCRDIFLRNNLLDWDGFEKWSNHTLSHFCHLFGYFEIPNAKRINNQKCQRRPNWTKLLNATRFLPFF